MRKLIYIMCYVLYQITIIKLYILDSVYIELPSSHTFNLYYIYIVYTHKYSVHVTVITLYMYMLLLSHCTCTCCTTYMYITY